jgi:hypothetical protein
MNMGSYDEGRYLICKHEDCQEPIRLLSQTLLKEGLHLVSGGGAISHKFLACRACGHVYGYIPQDVRFAGAGHMLGRGPETVPLLGVVEFPCGFQNCAAHVSILVPTSADNSAQLRAEVEQLKIGELHCREGHTLTSIPKYPAVSLDRADWDSP